MSRQKKSKRLQVEIKKDLTMITEPKVQGEISISTVFDPTPAQDALIDEMLKPEISLQDEIEQANRQIEDIQRQQLEMLESEIDRKRIELEQTKRELAEKQLELKTAGGYRDLDASERKSAERLNVLSEKQRAGNDKIAKMKAHDNQMVTGRFLNLRYKGQSIKLPYMKHVGDVAKWWPFDDGKVYTIPRGLADQINGGDETNPCYYMPTFTQKTGPMDPNEPESQVHSVDTSSKKYAFVAVGFN